MRLLTLFFIFAVLSMITSCNIEAVNDGKKPPPDSTVLFQNVSANNLPSGLSVNTQKARAADLNGDGAFDLVLAVAPGANKILINDGSGAFSDRSGFIPASNFNSRGVAVADFNSDGYPDLLFVNAFNEPNELYMGGGQGSYSDLSNRVDFRGNSSSVNAWDINNDGATDIMIGNRGPNMILINNGNAYFTNETTRRIPEQPTSTNSLTFGDINGDNWWDILTGEDVDNAAYINAGSGYFRDQSRNRIPYTNTIEQTYAVNLADVDSDGDFDLYYGNSAFESGAAAQDRLLINDGQGFFSDRTADRLPQLDGNTSAADFADLDNDGDLDAVVGYANGGIRVIVNNGSGRFADQTATWIEEDFAPAVNDLEIADFNGDGRWDLYLSVTNGNDQLLLYEN